MTELEKAARIALEALRHGVSQLNGIGIPTEADPLHTAITTLTQALTTTEPVQAVDERAAFEDWAKARSLPLDGHGGHYSNIRTRNNWLGWQARASQHATTEPDWETSPMDGEQWETTPMSATTERAGEPVAYREKITGRLCAPEDTHRRKFPMCYEPLYTSPQVPEDTARLDWIERQYLEDLSMRLVMDAPNDGQYYVCGDSGTPGYGKTLREAIDAARKKS